MAHQSYELVQKQRQTEKDRNNSNVYLKVNVLAAKTVFNASLDYNHDCLPDHPRTGHMHFSL